MMRWCMTQHSLVLALQFIAAGVAATARSNHTPELIAAGMIITWASCGTRWWTTMSILAERDLAFHLQIIWASASAASGSNVLMELSAGRHLMRGASHGTRWWSTARRWRWRHWA